MVEKIKEIKDQALRRMEQSINERGIERADVQEMGKLADIVKDLAEAEKACWEAEYYMSVTEAMGDGQMGYDGADGMRYAQNGSQGGYRSGYRGQSRDSMGRYTSRRGYRDGYGHQDMMQEIRQMMQTADPQEREQLKMQLRQMTEQM